VGDGAPFVTVREFTRAFEKSTEAMGDGEKQVKSDCRHYLRRSETARAFFDGRHWTAFAYS